MNTKDFRVEYRSCSRAIPSVNIGAFPEQDGYTRDYFRIDASVRQTLPFKGTEVYLDVNNLNNEKNSAAQTSIDGFTSVKNYGLTANFGVRYRI